MTNLRSSVIRLAHAKKAARITMEAHARDAQRDDDYRKTLEEFIDMERDAPTNARKARGGMKALEDIKETKAQYRI